MIFGLGSKSSSDDTLLHFIEQSPVALAELNAEFAIMNNNQAFSELIRFEDAGKPSLASLLNDADKALLSTAIQDALSGNAPTKPLHLTLQSSDNMPEMSIAIHISAMTMAGHDAPRIFAFITDVTEQKNLEMRFAHSQKMQAVGQLAGGVAHDFNNLLTAMIGFCDLLLMRHPAGDPSFADIMQVKQNANRAANLVRQLLAFSRRQTLQPKRLNLTDLLAELSNLIRRLIGENIELNIQHQREVWPVKVDQGQLEQVIINLAVNARDAMKEGGQLTIEASNITVDSRKSMDADLRPPPQEDAITPGDYVSITITDSGTGITDDVVDNIFEPFFSTKEVGSGTGLGLATVHGIVKQTGGYIYLKTKENEGTSFVVYIPRLVEAEDKSHAKEGKDHAHTQDLTGAATIMLVEDETPVRMFAARALQNKGYEVLEADCGENGLEVYAEHKDKIEVIISDVVMPGINGPTMVETLDKEHEDTMQHVEVIFISGYAEDAFADGYDGDREFNFLAKPFTLKQLAAKIKDITKTG